MIAPTVYIMASRRNGTLYTGVTSDLARRAYEHRTGLLPGFTRQYRCHLLVWAERHETMRDAIAREKQIKAGARAKKLALIEAMNPEWRDLYEALVWCPIHRPAVRVLDCFAPLAMTGSA